MAGRHYKSAEPPTMQWPVGDPDGEVSVTERLRDEPAEDGHADIKKLSIQHLQRAPTLVADCARLRHYARHLYESCDWSQLRRLHETRSEDFCHSWIWSINPALVSVMAEQDYILAL